MSLHFRDYLENNALDRYSDADIDDEEQQELTAVERRAAEVAMARRDRLERAGRRGTRAARRSHAPAFLESDDAGSEGDLDELGVARMKRRTRRQYDERRDIDDLDGTEDVSAFSRSMYLFDTFFFFFRNCLLSNSAISKPNQ